MTGSRDIDPASAKATFELNGTDRAFAHNSGAAKGFGRAQDCPQIAGVL